MHQQPITTILLCGFLGAGKTSLLSYLLLHENFKNMKCAALVNDFGSLAVDGALLPQGDYHLTEINKGSIFCVCVKTDLLRDLQNIAKNIRPDILFIEATGVAEPTDITSLLSTDFLKENYNKGATLCIIDALNFPKLVNILPALSAQVQIGDFIIVNKTDLVNEEQLDAIEGEIRKINSTAPVFRTEFSKIPLDKIDILRADTDSTSRDKLTLCEAAPEETISYELRSNSEINREEFYTLLDTYRHIILRGKGVISFGPESMFVEVINGTVSSKPARGIKFDCNYKSAMSFILRNIEKHREFTEQCNRL